MHAMLIVCIAAALCVGADARASHGADVPAKAHDKPVNANGKANAAFPIVVNTWSGANSFSLATLNAWNVLASSADASALDGIEAGCSTCERQQCDGSVGYGGSPDEADETTLDSMIMDGVTGDIGAVGDLRRVKNAIGVARHVMHYTDHTLLAGDHATAFALQNGFPETNLTTNASTAIWSSWEAANCQPNYRQNVLPDPTASCGPYTPITSARRRPADGVDLKRALRRGDTTYGVSPTAKPRRLLRPREHDTIGMIAIDQAGRMACGTSTNGLTHKVPGRVGDSPVPGAGSWVDSAVGGCGATGDGDIMMRFAPCYQTVESMRLGMSPSDAAADAINRIRAKYPTFQGALVALNAAGEHGGACNNWSFTYSVKTPATNAVQVMPVTCFSPDQPVPPPPRYRLLKDDEL